MWGAVEVEAEARKEISVAGVSRYRVFGIRYTVHLALGQTILEKSTGGKQRFAVASKEHHLARQTTNKRI